MTSGAQLVQDIRAEKAVPPSGITTLGLHVTHRWLTLVEPGHVTLSWPVNPAYFNLDNAVICSWIVALADQAIFFAAQTLCGEGEGTRMDQLSVQLGAPMTAGEVMIDARAARQDEVFDCLCVMRTADDELAATVTANVLVTR